MTKQKDRPWKPQSPASIYSGSLALKGIEAPGGEACSELYS